ncbi:cytosine permease [Rhizobium sp. ZPR3]|uniref:Cytosine permease n=2 Tax=unclassified Rhizobium TaxID=2613769 RepID=A0AAU7SR86_9HYPH
MSIIKRLSGIVEGHPHQGPAEDDMQRWPSMTMLIVGGIISVPLFTFGGEVGKLADYSTILEALLISSIFLGVFGVTTGYIGIVTRLPTAMILQRTFGIRGSLAITIMLTLVSIGWFGIQLQIIVQSVAAILHKQLNISVNEHVGIILTGLLISSTAIIGIKAMGKVAVIGVPLLLIATLIPLGMGMSNGGLDTLFGARDIPHAYSLGMLVSLIVGTEVFPVSINPDLSRFLKTNRDNRISMLLGFGLAFPLLLALAAALGIIYNNADLVTTMLVAGIALPGLAVIILATWTNNDQNLYSSALSLSAIFPRMERWHLACLAALAGTGLAAVDVLGHFILLLNFMGLALAPMAGVYVADFFLDRPRYTATAPQLPSYRPYPVASWIFGTVLGFTTLPSEESGLGLFHLTGAPSLDALVSAMLLLFIAKKFFSANASNRQIIGDEKC